MQWLFNLLRSPHDPPSSWDGRKKYRRQLRTNKIVDFFDPLSVRNLSNVEEFKAPPFRQIKPLKDWFNLNDDSA